MRLPDEDHQDMYSRLLIVADSFRLIGATHINDSWIKEKYIECMMPYVPIDVKTLVGRECYSSLSSQDVVHEMQALKVLEQNSHDSLNRAIGMSKGNNLAFVVNPVEEVHPQEQYRASWSMSYPEDLECHYHDHMAFHAKSFWVDPSKAKEDNIKRNHKSGFTSFGPKTRSCYNCDDKRHFIAECPYENRELHNGRLIPKDKSKESKGKYSKAPNKKFYNNKTKKGKKPPRVVLVTREEYSSDEVVSSSDDEEGSSKEVAAIVTTNIPSSSLFESPNENPHIKNAHCFMATSSLDTSIVLSTQEEYSSGDDDDVDDEEDATSNGLVALASLSTNSSSPSESPNEIIHVEEESCLMAKSSEVSSPSPSMPNISSDLGVDDASLKVKQEMLEFDEFMFNLQDQAHEVELSQEIEEAQIEGQDGDPNDQVDQVTPPRPKRTKEEIEARRLARRDRTLEIRGHTHDKVLGDVRAKVSTRRQLANFSNHHAYISVVEPKKVFEALEDSDWVEAMHEELNNFKRNKVRTLVEKPKECRNVIGTKWIFKNKQDEFGNIVRNKLMTDRFEMSMMGEMKFFLGFEIKQLREGTFINQAKYLQDMLKRFKMTELKGVATPMVTKCHLALDPNGKEVDQKPTKKKACRPGPDQAGSTAEAWAVLPPASGQYTLDRTRPPSPIAQPLGAALPARRRRFPGHPPATSGRIGSVGAFPHISSSMAPGASGSGSAKSRKRRGVPILEDEFVEQDEVLPRATTARGASLANKKKGKPGIESYGSVRLHAYMAIRTANPYLGPRSSRTRNRHFYTEVQERIFNEVYPPNKVKVVDQRYINIDHLKKDAYFHEALVYFHEDDARSITWMTRDEVLTTTWSTFGQILGYPLPENCEDDRDSGWRFHGHSNASTKDVLEPLYMPGRCKLGFTSGLQPVYNIMLRIYRETVAVKVGNVDESHSFVIDLMLQTHLRKGKGVKMDVMDCLWNQIFLRMVEKRSPAFGPFIMKLISEVWRQKFEGAILEPFSSLTVHKRKNLLIKDHELLASTSASAAPSAPAAPSAGPADPSTAPARRFDGFIAHMALGAPPAHSAYDPMLEPSWYTKLKIKVKKTFCLQLDIQERMYDAYVAEKKARRRQKSIMTKLGVEVSPPEENILP
ncbi:hypothetical protein QYE76_063994 [Lolium multiflorum]|uniref:Reverse transcriptase Ty1/copia-type domain-containing protein n=1 Tax=Lolium multiflorum TaxID=4521 RepID=A0AAD8W9M1_LOLMU|nr:hypothetical protein QYE76_063994 [Lolium multiflorum]